MALGTTMMDSVATHKRPRSGQDPRGGSTQNFATLDTGIPCSAQQPGASVIMSYGQRQINVTCVLFFPDDVDAQVNDVFTVTDQYDATHTFLCHGYHKYIFNRLLSPFAADCEELD